MKTTRDKMRRNKFYFNENPIAIMRLEKADKFIMLKKNKEKNYNYYFFFHLCTQRPWIGSIALHQKPSLVAPLSLEAISTLLTSRTLQSLIISDASAKSIQSVCSLLTPAI